MYFTVFGLIFLAISLTGIAGYITFGNQNESRLDLIIFRDSIFETDYLMQTARFALLFSLLIFGGLKINPIKSLIFQLSNIERNSLNNLLITVSYCLGIGLISHYVKIVKDLVAFVGSSIGFLLLFIFPIFLSFKINYCETNTKRLLMKIYLVVMFFLMILLTYRALVNLLVNSNIIKK